jgi:hypothetical protein
MGCDGASIYVSNAHYKCRTSLQDVLSISLLTIGATCCITPSTKVATVVRIFNMAAIFTIIVNLCITKQARNRYFKKKIIEYEKLRALSLRI